MNNNKILIIFPGGIGDVILLSPSLIKLREEYPQAQIDIILEQRSIKVSQELLNNIISNFKVFDFQNKFKKFPELLKQIQGYDTVLSSGNSPLVSLLLFMSRANRRIGFQSKLSSILLTDSIKLNKQQYASSMFGDLFSTLIPAPKTQELTPKLLSPYIPVIERQITEEYILIHPGVSLVSVQKNILKSPDINYWQELIAKLQETTNYKIILTGGKDEEELLNSLEKNTQATVIRPSSFLELAGLIKYSDYFICVDSAPLHLAVALPANNIIALFAGTDETKLTPANINNLSIIKQDKLLCRPCLWEQRPNSCQTPLCVQWQSPQQVLNIIN